MTAPLTLDDATQFTRAVLWDGVLVSELTVQKVQAGKWSVAVRSIGLSQWLGKKWRSDDLDWFESVSQYHFPTAQAALDAAMATPQITEVES